MARKKRRRASELTEPPPPPGPRLVGYARVSTEDQNLAMQVQALVAAGVREGDIHVEKVSASSKRRPTFEWLLNHSIRPGDTIVVWKLDRLMRSLIDLLKIMETLKEQKVNFRSLTEQIDLSTPTGTLTFNIIASLAQWERDIIRERTRSGVAAAKARGVRFGQPHKLDKKQVAAVKRWRREGLVIRAIVDRVQSEFEIKVSHTAVANYLKRKR